MLLLTFTLRRLFRHWAINLVVFTGLVLTGALVAGLPAYAEVVAANSLELSLENAPVYSRNLILTAPEEVRTFNAAVQKIFEEDLGFMVSDQIEVRETSTGAFLTLKDEHGEKVPGPAYNLSLWSFSPMTSYAHLVEGKWPSHQPASNSPTAMFDPQRVEAAITKEIADASGLKVGDVLGEFLPIGGFDYAIVGIYERNDPTAPIWWEDPRPFALEVILGLNEDTIITPLLLPPLSLAEYFPSSARNWRVVVNQDIINPENAPAIKAALVKAQGGFEQYGLEISTGIPLLLENYESQLAIAKIALYLLTVQALIFVFYTLGMVTSFMLDRSQSELATLASRGTGRGQVMLLFSLEGFLLALPGAALLGPILMEAILRQWVKVTGMGITSTLPTDSRLLALAAAVIGWISFSLPAWAASGKSLLEWQQSRARPAQQAAWQRRNLDIFLLILSGLAYWQLSQSGSFVLQRVGDTAFADPLLLIGPSLLLIAIALLFLRIFPYILRAIHGWLNRGRGLILAMGMARLARDPVGPSRVVLLISLAAALSLFSLTFRKSLEQRQAEVAHYLAGADVRVEIRRRTLNDVLALGGVQAASTVYRMRVPGFGGRFVNLLGVDAATLPNVAAYPPGFGGTTMEEIARVLTAPTPSGLPAIIVSHRALPNGAKIGDELTVQITQRFPKFEIRGIIEEFPTVDNLFMLVDVHALDDWRQLAGVNLATQEAWLSVDPAKHDALVATLNYPGEVIGDTKAQLRAFQANALTEGAKRAFALNAQILAVLSVAGFLLVHYFSAQQRMFEFSLLRAGGLSAGQLLGLLVSEGVIVMGLGLGAGTVIGWGLSVVMRPFLSRVFANALAGAVVERIVVDWAAVGQTFGLLAAFYALALLVSVIALLRVGVHKVLRVSVE